MHAVEDRCSKSLGTVADATAGGSRSAASRREAIGRSKLPLTEVSCARQVDVVQHGVIGSTHLVLEEAAAARAVELTELDLRVDEPLRVADQWIGGLDGPVDAQCVDLVVLVH